MARTKTTPKKKTGPKGVPRHQLAPRDDGAGPNRTRGDVASSSRPRPDPQEEIQRLTRELAQATRTVAECHFQIGDLQGELERRTLDYEDCYRLLVERTLERNAVMDQHAQVVHDNQLLVAILQVTEENNVALQLQVQHLNEQLQQNIQPQAPQADLGDVVQVEVPEDVDEGVAQDSDDAGSGVH